jgi:HEAT repeat protein
VNKKIEIVRSLLNASGLRGGLGANVSRDLDLVIRYLVSKEIRVSRIEDLKDDIAKWRRAVPEIPTLIKQVETNYVKEALVRFLAVPFAKGAAEDVVKLFRSIDDHQFRWAAGNTLEVIASDKIAAQLIDIALDRSLESSRQMVVLALGKLRTKDAATAAMSLLDDDSVVLHALGALAKLHAREARPQVEALLHHKRAAVRKEARKTLERISRE